MKKESKAAQHRRADRTLRILLKTPKTRKGLIAAVSGGHISRNFVFGWLAECRRNGTITTLKSGNTVMFQITEHVVIESPVQSEYPAWLDPRTLPPSVSRAVYVDGALAKRAGNN